MGWRIFCLQQYDCCKSWPSSTLRYCWIISTKESLCSSLRQFFHPEPLNCRPADYSSQGRVNFAPLVSYWSLRSFVCKHRELLGWLMTWNRRCPQVIGSMCRFGKRAAPPFSWSRLRLWLHLWWVAAQLERSRHYSCTLLRLLGSSRKPNWYQLPKAKKFSKKPKKAKRKRLKPIYLQSGERF